VEGINFCLVAKVRVIASPRHFDGKRAMLISGRRGDKILPDAVAFTDLVWIVGDSERMLGSNGVVAEIPVVGD
jgi:hypothetical protein